MIWLGMSIDHLTDNHSRTLIFIMISIFCCLKLYYEIDTYINPDKRITQNIKDVNKNIQAILLALFRVIQVTQMIVLSKWFSRMWFPFFVSIWFLSQSIGKFLSDLMRCNRYEIGKTILNLQEKQCLRKESIFGIISCVVTFSLGLMILLYYTIDPLDADLIINE